ncbi:MAG TPA: hypothetical protein VF700_07360 [Segetibacter sp.]
MTKFLLTILLIVIGLKLIVDDALVYKYTAVSVTLQDEEGNSEKGDNENSKKDEDKKGNEDKFFCYYSIDSGSFNTEVKLFPTLVHHLPDSGFADKPYTPPEMI